MTSGDYRRENFRDIKFDHSGYAGQNESGEGGQCNDAEYLESSKRSSAPEKNKKVKSRI